MAQRVISLQKVLDMFDDSCRPTIRNLREDMSQKGYARKQGRQYITTIKQAEAYIKEITGEVKCQKWTNSGLTSRS